MDIIEMIPGLMIIVGSGVVALGESKNQRESSFYMVGLVIGILATSL